MLGWIILFALLIFAYSMGYATRALISASRRRQAAEFRKNWPGRSAAQTREQSV